MKMGKGSRFPMQLSPEFHKKMKELRAKIMAMQMDDKVSYRDLSEKIVKSPKFDELENNILKSLESVDKAQNDIKLNLDKRKKKK